MQKYIRTLSLALLCSFTALVIFSYAGEAATVTKTKDKRVIINLDGMNLNVGERVYLTRDGKKLAIVTIKQVKNGRALGEVDKGSAAEGMEVLRNSSSRNNINASADAGADDSGNVIRKRRRHKGFQFGVIGGVAMDNQTVTLANVGATVTESVAMNGMGFDLNFIGDYALNDTFGIRLGIGYESFSVTGNSMKLLCAQSTSGSCTTSISFVAAEGWGHVNVIGTNSPIWLGLGGEFLVPISSSSNALDPGSIATNFAIGGGLGINWRFGQNTIVPIQFDYMVLPSSATATTNVMRIRAGLMF